MAGGALQAEDTACCCFSWKGFSEPPSPPLPASTPSLFSLALGAGHVVSGSQAGGFGEMPGWGGWAPTPGGVAGRAPSPALPCIPPQSRLCVLLGPGGQPGPGQPGAAGKMPLLGDTGRFWAAVCLAVLSWPCRGLSGEAGRGEEAPLLPRLPPAQHLPARTSPAQDEVPCAFFYLLLLLKTTAHAPSQPGLPPSQPLRCPSHSDTTPSLSLQTIGSPRRRGPLCLAHPASEVWGPGLAHHGCSVRVPDWPNDR